MNLKRKLMTVGAIGAVALSSLAPTTAFAAEEESADLPDISNSNASDTRYSQLSNYAYTPGDLLSSVIYSESSEVKSADGLELSYKTLAAYPSASDGIKTYGQLIAPTGDTSVDENGSSTEGERLVSQLKTYYEYGWFEPLPKNDESFLSPVVRLVRDVPKNIGDHFARGALQSALIGAQLYDAGTSFIEAFSSLAGFVNVPALFGLTGDGVNDGFLNELVSGTLAAFGFSAGTILIIQRLTMSFFVFFMIVMTIWALRSTKNRTSHVHNSKKWGSRILIMLMTVPVWVSVTNAWNFFDNSVANLNNAAPDEINSSYIVDTLDWAIYGNLDLKMVNPSGSLNTDATASADFAPTPERVAYLGQRIQEEKNKLGGDSNAETSAHGMLSAFLSGGTANVNDYISGLASLNCLSTSNTTITGQQVVECTHRNNPNSLTRFDIGVPNETLFATERASRPYFLSPREDQMDTDKTGGVKQEQTIVLSGVEFKLTETSPVSARPLRFNDPKSYIYGAIPSENLSTSTAEYANYIYDPRTSSQLVNPETGKAVTDEPASDEAENDKLRAIRSNALHIAIYNRFAGLNDGLALSDQSTTFFLQSKRSGDSGINYKGYNTVANETGESKNTGAYGNAFVRYVMPVTNPGDYAKNISALNTVWVTSGFIAIAACFILLRSPVFGAMFYSIKGFLGSLFTGNIYSFLEGILYYSAMRLSFICASAAIYFGAFIGKFFLLDSPLAHAIGLVGGDALQFTDAILTGGFVTSVVGAFAILVALLWPALNWTNGRGSNRKISILGAIIMLPYMLVSSWMTRVERLATNFYGKAPGGNRMLSVAGSRSAKGARANELAATGKKPGSVAGKVAKTGLKVGAGVALATATGGAGSAIAASALKNSFGNSMAGKVAGKVAFAGMDKAANAFSTSRAGQLIGKPLGALGRLGGAAFDKTGLSERLSTIDENGNKVSGSQVLFGGFKDYDNHIRRINNPFFKEDSHLASSEETKPDMNGQEEKPQNKAPQPHTAPAVSESNTVQQTPLDQPDVDENGQNETTEPQGDQPQGSEWARAVSNVPQFTDAHFDHADIDQATIGDQGADDVSQTQSDTVVSETDENSEPQDDESVPGDANGSEQYDERVDARDIEQPSLAAEQAKIDAQSVEADSDTADVDIQSADSVDTEEAKETAVPESAQADNPEAPEVEAQSVNVHADESTVETPEAQTSAQSAETQADETTVETPEAHVDADETETPEQSPKTDWGNLADELNKPSAEPQDVNITEPVETTGDADKNTVNVDGTVSTEDVSNEPQAVNVTEPVETHGETQVTADQPLETRETAPVQSSADPQQVVVNEPVRTEPAQSSEPQQVVVNEPVKTEQTQSSDPQQVVVNEPVKAETTPASTNEPQQVTVNEPVRTEPTAAPQNAAPAFVQPAPAPQSSSALVDDMLKAMDAHAQKERDRASAKPVDQMMRELGQMFTGEPATQQTTPAHQNITTVNNVTNSTSNVAPPVAPVQPATPVVAPNVPLVGETRNGSTDKLANIMKEIHEDNTTRAEQEKKERLMDRRLAKDTFERLPNQSQAPRFETPRLDRDGL